MYGAMTYIAVPIAAKNIEQAARRLKAAHLAGAEMIELRTDYLENLNSYLVKTLIARAKHLAEPPLPLIVTCRDSRQGGAIDYRLRLRLEVLTAALQAGADFIDFEYENFASEPGWQRLRHALAVHPQAKLILSAHNFNGTFNDLNAFYSQIVKACPSAVPKLVYTASHINDCFEAFDLLGRIGGKAIVLCMGEAGLISRILAKKLNAFLTFASLDEETATAPGQLSIEQIKNLYRYDSLNPETQLYGIIGSPVAHSVSPAAHNASFALAGLDKLYLPLLVAGGAEQFTCFMDNVIARSHLNFRGFSVTIPHKRNALEYVCRRQGFVEPLAQKIGAVNTVLIDPQGKLYAYNTDYAGAIDSITAGLGVSREELTDLNAAVIGAGGVARAVVAGLCDAGAKVKIYNRTIKRAEKLAAEFNCYYAGLDELPQLDAALLVNCTSVGMHPHINASPIDPGCLKKDMVVFDTVYNPLVTLLLKQAGAAGATTIDGMSMFVNQAVAQFKLFTGQDAETKLMRKTISKWFSLPR